MNPKRHDLEHSHDPADIRERLAGDKHRSYLPDAILGGIDGCITTLALVASVAGAGLPGMVAFVLGLASLIADALSMAVSNYQAVKSTDEARHRLREQEHHHVAVDPEGSGRRSAPSSRPRALTATPWSTSSRPSPGTSGCGWRPC